ncbi:type VI protein secretion system component VasK [Parvibaculum indicum]|uniref:hypothetical protein n=1 Tax=Parvibaculum indicum TaxID=562969 RepID=UPI001965C6C3|nr:hypothetical protein [Parvibaculum indicum]NIJ42384.1 type VI protein secretion system component VasK [Parvibaculum indicum]
MTHRKTIFVFTLIVAAAWAAPAMAYVGPGAGLSVLSALFGVLAAVGAALAFIVVWPLRRALRKRRKAQPAVDGGTSDSAADIRSQAGY